MTYIGGTLYAPVGFDIETFQEVFDQLAAAGFEVDEPSAIGRGEYSERTIKLRIKSVTIKREGVEALQQALAMVYPSYGITVEAIGSDAVQLKPNFTGRLVEAVKKWQEGIANAEMAQRDRAKRDNHQRYLNSLSVDELRSQGYYNEAREREEAEAAYSTEPDYY